MLKNRVYSQEIREGARDLRSQGWSLGEISLKMGVLKNTISGWVKGIQLTESQRKRIKEKEITCAARGRSLATKLMSKKIEKWKEGIREKVRHFGNSIFQNPEIGKLICGLLYLCEGAKYPSTRCLTFGNSDPKIIYIFLTLLRKYYNIDENKLRFNISYRWDQDLETLKDFWSKLTNIPKSKCLKNKPDIRTKGKPTLRENYKGVCGIIYYDTSLQFELQAIGEAIINGGADGN